MHLLLLLLLFSIVYCVVDLQFSWNTTLLSLYYGVVVVTKPSDSAVWGGRFLITGVRNCNRFMWSWTPCEPGVE